MLDENEKEKKAIPSSLSLPLPLSRTSAISPPPIPSGSQIPRSLSTPQIPQHQKVKTSPSHHESNGQWNPIPKSHRQLRQGYKLIRSGTPDRTPSSHRPRRRVAASLSPTKSFESSNEDPPNSPKSAAGSPVRAERVSRSRVQRPDHLKVPGQRHPHRSRLQTHKHRQVSREIAAIDFLQNIPMQSERTPATQTTTSGTGIGAALSRASKADEITSLHIQYQSEGVFADDTLAGRRLPGPAAVHVCIPALFRYRLATKHPASSAVVRRWETLMNEKGLLDSRLFMSSEMGYPNAVCSVIKYDGNTTKQKKKPSTFLGESHSTSESTAQANATGYDWRGKSYWYLLHSTWGKCDPARDKQSEHPIPFQYNPNQLDDPETKQGRHRHVITGDRHIGPIMTSILLYVKPKELKEDLNRQFRETHSQLDPSMTLSKIRNLKMETLKICHAFDLEISSCALACVYFEKLVLQQYVTKANRKLVISVCFILALKFNSPNSWEKLKNTAIKKALEDIDRVHSISSEEVFSAEFDVYAALAFSLHVQLRELEPHFVFLLKKLENNPKKYLGTSYDHYAEQLIREQEQEEANDAEIEPERTVDDLYDASSEDCDSPKREKLNLLSFEWNGVSFTQWWKERTKKLKRSRD